MRPRSAFAPITLLLACVLLATVLAVPATAETGPYLSARFGNTDFELDFDDAFDSIFEGDEDSKAFEVGYRIFDWLGVQVGYHDFGSFNVSDICEACLATTNALGFPLTVDAEAWSVSALAEMSLLPFLSIYGKAGVARVEAKLNSEVVIAVSPFGELEDEEALLGAGLRLWVLPTKLNLFAEIERIGDDFETASVGVSLQF